ncbi:MAG: sensor histidine kinase [Gammaproteobacteria bacterium]
MMNPRSIRLRFLGISGLAIALALPIAAFSLVQLFENHVERRIAAELDTYLNQIISSVTLDTEGNVRFDATLPDPRFAKPFSGLYWQIQDEDQAMLLRSRSLWDQRLPLPVDELPAGDIHQHELPGPQGQELLTRERRVILLPDSARRHLRISVAIDHASLTEATQGFAKDMSPYLLGVAIILIITTWVQLRLGLSPLWRIREAVQDIRSGRSKRLQDDHPDEVQPLVEEINALLDAQARSIESARAWTADLAHGLKTPLALLSADAEKLRRMGNPDMAEELDQLAEGIRRRVDRELNRARLQSAPPSEMRAEAPVCELIECAQRVINAVARTPGAESLDWQFETGDAQTIPVAMRQNDLTELLGNILENAAKWAQTEVNISVATSDSIRLLIQDDGPGVPDDKLNQLRERGVRLDENSPGNGLGLAIARDIVDAYGGKLTFQQAVKGGLVVQIDLPSPG